MRAALALELRRDLERDIAKIRLVLLLGTVARARDRQRQRALRRLQPEMQRSEAAHRQSDDVRAVDAGRVHHGDDVVDRRLLRIAFEGLRHVRRREPARAEGDAAMAAREVPHLRFPAPVIAAEFVDEDNGSPGAGLFVVQLQPVVGLCETHGHLPFRTADRCRAARGPCRPSRAAVRRKHRPIPRAPSCSP